MKYFILIFLCILSATAMAQEPVVADSILLHQQAFQNFEGAKWGTTQLIASEISKTSFIGLTYDYQNGHFRTSQQAEKTTSATFSAEGISTIDRFKLYGYFSFNRTWQDSLAFSQKGIEDNFSPYYYIAGKAGVFERQRYLGGGIITYNLLKDKLYIGTGVDYLYNTSARSVDPRSSVTTFKLKFSPTLSYKIGNSIIGIGMNAGYGDEKNAINYKNADFQGTLLYPNRISYFNYGYGYLEINQSDFYRRNTYTGLNLNYTAKISNWNVLSRLRYLISKEDNQYPKSNSIKDQTFGTFQLETYEFDVLLNKKSVQTANQITLNFSQNNGDDELLKLAARNYTYNATVLNIGYNHYRNRKNQPSYAYFANLKYNDVYQRDAAADHTTSYTYVQPKVGTTWYWEQSKRNFFSTELGIGARIPLQNEIIVPITQQNIFTEGVAYPDYLYWSSNVGEVNLTLNYTTDQLIKKFKTGFTLNSNYLLNFSKLYNTLNTNFTPGKHSLNFNFAVNLYF